MRNLSFNECKCDLRYLIAVIITFICAIICGIVLYKVVTINIYFKNFAEDYVYYVFNFKNSKLIFSHILRELIYIYLFFLIGYFTRFKYLTLILVFIRGLYFTVYVAILFELVTFGGITVAILVFIPTYIISFAFCWFIAEYCKLINKKYIFFVPAILALTNTVVLTILVNVVFRVVIVIV